MDFYCHLLLEKLKIPKTQWNEYLKTAKSLSINFNEDPKTRSFLGQSNSTGLVLPAITIHELHQLDIYPQDDKYLKGLASIETKTRSRLSLLAIDAHISLNLESESEWLDQLILATKLIQLLLEEHLYLSSPINLELLIHERDLVYAQIACFCLPCTFLQEINAPTNFLTHTAPKLGQYIIQKRNR